MALAHSTVTVSKTRMIELVRKHQAQAVEHALADNPALAAYRDDRGRNWLHLCCMARPARGSGASLRTAADIMRRKKDPEFHRLAERLISRGATR